MYSMKNLCDLNDWLDAEKHLKIGDLLIQSGKITLEDLGTALDIQNFKKMPLGEIFVSMKLITPEELEDILSLQTRIDRRVEKKD